MSVVYIQVKDRIPITEIILTKGLIFFKDNGYMFTNAFQCIQDLRLDHDYQRLRVWFI